MQLHLFCALYLTTLTIFILINLPGLTCSNDTRFLNCSQPFNCGSVQNLKYPFWGENRPSYCGLPEFELRCLDDVPIMTLSSQKYRILNTDPETHKLRIARADFWDGICPSILENTSIDSTLFNYTLDPSYLTLYYGCFFPPWVPSDVIPHYFCKINGTHFDVLFSYGMFGPYQGCKYRVRVPILEAPAREPGVSTASILEALHKGFELQWILNEDQCLDCTTSGGQCGWNWTHKAFSCFCPEQACAHGSICASGNNYAGNSSSTDKSQKSEKSSHNAAIIGAVVGGVGLLAFVACASLFVLRRRRRFVSQAESKDVGLGPPGPPSSRLPSSNGFRYSQESTTSPSTNRSQSIPSYPSSKSDLDNASFCHGVKVFSCTELEEATDNFNESRELGDGGFGTVYYGKLRDGREVAVKRLYESSCRRMGQFKTEVQILAHLRHENLVALYGCTSVKNKELLLVYEYIPNGTVADHLHGKLAKSNALPWSTRLSIAVQTAEALSFLHKSAVVHRDVKTTNILLENDFQVKVADFGLSRLFPNDVTHVSTAPQGTPGYVDPDYYKCYRLTEKSDVYSFGVVLVELISSKPAVDITRHRHDINLSNMAIDRIRRNALHELVDPDLGCDKDYVVQKMVKLVAELAFQCLQEDREMRPCMEEVLNSLRGIQKEMKNSLEQVVVDIPENDDDIGLLRDALSLLSPETEAIDETVR